MVYCSSINGVYLYYCLIVHSLNFIECMGLILLYFKAHAPNNQTTTILYNISFCSHLARQSGKVAFNKFNKITKIEDVRPNKVKNMFLIFLPGHFFWALLIFKQNFCSFSGLPIILILYQRNSVKAVILKDIFPGHLQLVNCWGWLNQKQIIYFVWP